MQAFTVTGKKNKQQKKNSKKAVIEWRQHAKGTNCPEYIQPP